MVDYPFAARTIPQRNTVARSSEPNTRRSNTKPIAPMTAREASIRPVLRNSLASKMTQPRYDERRGTGDDHFPEQRVLIRAHGPGGAQPERIDRAHTGPGIQQHR